MDVARSAAAAGAVGLAAASGLHASWALGAAWPAQDRRALAAAVAGTERMPGAAKCWAVSGALAVAAAVTAGAGGAHPLAVTARVGVVTAFLVRATTGLTEQTYRLVSWTPSQRFVDLDRRWYGPACGLLAGLAVGSLRR